MNGAATVRPILFSAPMVRALLEGRKTQTRRLLKPEPDVFYLAGEPAPVEAIHVQGDPCPRIAIGRVITMQQVRFAVDDLLWVRETVHIDGRSVSYRADHPGDATGLGWRPSIHMPRWASRLTLKVTGVKVHRLYDLGDGDIRAEGVQHDGTDASWLHQWRQLWESIHGPGDFETNPWVVAITFEVIKQNIDVLLANPEPARSPS